MAARTFRMLRLRRCKGGLVAVTTEARGPPRGDEVVRLVTALTCRVTGCRWPLRLLMTVRAGGRGVAGSRVGFVAIGTRLATGVRCVPRSSFLVARRAVRNSGRLMRFVTRRTRDRCVMRDWRVYPLRLRVAVDAPRRLRCRREAVTAEATRRIAKLAAVPPAHFFGVAIRASCGAGIFESLVRQVVAAAAFDVGLIDVGHVPGAQANLCPRGRDVRRNRRGCLRPPRRESRDDQHYEHAGAQARPELPPPGHGPTPWQRRHGWSCVLFRSLRKPGPWGLPPGPPTRWQPTHSCSPAPPWQPAHDVGSMRACTPWSPPPAPVVIHPCG